MASGTRKRPTRRAILLGSALLPLVGFVLAETALRLFDPQVFPVHEPGMLQADPILGHSLTPNWSGRFRRAEFDVGVTTNGEGHRNAAASGSGRDTTRVLCIGDSITWGWGVDDHETYPAQLAQELGRRHPEATYLVTNAGVPYYGTVDELALLEARVDRVEVDVVIVQFNAANDFEQNRLPSRERHAFEEGILLQSREFERSTVPWWLDVLSRLKHKSHAVHFVSERAGRLAMRTGALGTLERASSAHFTREEAERAASLLEAAGVVAVARGARVLYLFVPEKLQVIGSFHVSVRASAVLDFARRHGDALVVDITPVLIGQTDVESLFGRNEGFLTARAHSLVARELAEAMDTCSW